MGGVRQREEEVGRLAIVLFVFASCGGVMAESVDYSGFWKWNCSDAFGLQVKEQSDGLYSVMFCGPGGTCNRVPREGELTPIEGDPKYEVVSPFEIRERLDGVEYGILYKCTDETNPVLKYSDEDVAEGKRNQALMVLVHVGYLLGAILAYRSVRKHLLDNSWRGRLTKAGVVAFLFSPGLALTWPFVSPTFASLALVFAFLPSLFTSPIYALMVLTYAVGPMAACAVLVFVWLSVVDALRAHRH